MKQELINEIVLMLKRSGIECVDLAMRLTLLMEPYKVEKAETALAVRSLALNDEYIRRFIAVKMVDGCTERTIYHYTNTLRMVFPKIKKIADEVTTDDIRALIAKRRFVDGVSPTTADNELMVLKTFYSFMLSEGYVKINPAMKLKKIKAPKKKKEAFTHMEIEMIRNACRTNREKAIVELLLSTGCRVSELCGIQIAEIQKDRVIVHGKGQKDRCVFLNAKAQIFLEKYLAERIDGNQYLFPKGIDGPKMGLFIRFGKDWYMHPEYIQDGHMPISTLEEIVREIGKRAGVENCHPHRFRRTCATYALKRGMGLTEVSRMLGHENIATTQIYLDISDDAVEAAHRRYVT